MTELYHYLINNIYQFLGVFFSIIYVFFSIKQNILCWPALIVAATFNIFAYHLIDLSLQVIMQFFFIATGFYGWYNWGNPKGAIELKVIHWRTTTHLIWVSIGIILTCSLFMLLKQVDLNSIFYSKYPLLDALMFTFNIIPMYMTGRKILESWLYFILIDIVSGVFYIITGELFFAFLFFCYIGFAYYGYLTWRKELT